MIIDRLASKSLRLLGFGVAATLLVAACSGSAATPTAAPVATPAPAGGSVTLASTTTSLGTFLTDQAGVTLYYFAKDTSPNASVCSGQCASNWPALTVAAGQTATAGSGVTGTIGTFARSDGTTQVSYDTRPLYYFAADAKAPGAVKGQGVGGIWFVAAVDGTMPSAPPATPAAGSQAPAASAAASPAASTGATTYTIATATASGKTFLTGENGKSLYEFSKDSTNTTACTASGCTSNWPAFTLDPGEKAVAGLYVTGTVGTFTRSDNSATQVSYNGKPLYYFAGDAKAGDTNGSSIPNWGLATP